MVSAALLGLGTLAGCTAPEPRAAPTTAPGETAANPSTHTADSAEGTTPGGPETDDAPSPRPEPADEATAKPEVGQVGVLITSQAWDPLTGLSVNGYAETVDPVATCTLEVTSGETTRRATADASEGPTTMSCGDLTVPADQLGPGSWTAVLAYESSTASGRSPAVIVTVP